MFILPTDALILLKVCASVFFGQVHLLKLIKRKLVGNTCYPKEEGGLGVRRFRDST